MNSKQENIYCDLEKRLFYLSDDIDNTSIGKMSYFLLNLIQCDDKGENEKTNFTREPIKIYINSYGGDVYDMWSLIDIMLNSKTPIYTYCTGYAMSSGFLIFLAGHKKFASKHSTFLFHHMSCCRSGKYQDLVENRKELDWLNNSIEEYVSKRTRLTENKIKEIREKKQDYYIHIDEALELKIIDEII